MASVRKSKGAFTVRAHVGDAKTLLAFNLDKAGAKNLAGFTIHCQPKQGAGYYLLNQLQFEHPGDHAQDTALPPYSTFNAPIAKFRWLHVPGLAHQGLKPFFGPYTYTVTPRYFSNEHVLLPIDPGRSVAVKVDVRPFKKGSVTLGFTRGFTQSQAFVHHFGKNAPLVPADRGLVFDTSEEAGTSTKDGRFTFRDEFEWMGFTAREKIFSILEAVLADRSLHLDVLAYDLNEPDVVAILLKLAAKGRIRVVLDNAALHHTKPGAKTKSGKPKEPTWEDKFEAAFKKAKKKDAAILRGRFGRYSHDKIFIVSKNGKAKTVLTGSTNFSVTGLYVNSNHVLVIDDPKLAGTYLDLFEEIWKDKAKRAAFMRSAFPGRPYEFKSAGVPRTEVTFSPHAEEDALNILQGVADRIAKEGRKPKGKGSVLFAVMQLDGSDSTVYRTLAKVHRNRRIFSFGISDTTKGISLYKPGLAQGVLVTGKPAATVLPPPFDQVPNIKGFGHQVHHKFVVCGFNSDDAVVYCGSSNLASGGEEKNGDNLLAVHDTDIATAFAIEAVGLVDHFNFLDRYAAKAAQAGKGKKKRAAKKPMPESKTQAAVSAGWFLYTNDWWTRSYYRQNDLHYWDREIFA